MPIESIDQVLIRLTSIVDESIQHNQRIGYFAALYLRVTWSVKRAILAGDVFQDNQRMEKLDVAFACRFLHAWDTWIDGGEPSGPWKIAFDALKRNDLMVVQHMALAMNAHIDFDLGIATDQVMEELGQPLDDIHADFNMINTILTRLIGIVQVQLAEMSPTFKDIERLAPGVENHLFGEVMKGLRDEAWKLATRLSRQQHDAARQRVLDERQALVDVASKLIRDAGEVPLFAKVVADVVDEETANGIPYNIQVAAE